MNDGIAGLDATMLSRIQFGFTITFHILFPSFSIGLAGFLVALEVLWLRTGDAIYWRLLRFWTSVFALSFGMGVVSGLVLAYQFGTNWSGLMARAGQIMGPLLSYETMTAFFLEASFLGILLFGWRRVSRSMHLFATCMVALGTCISAFWIMASNSWMQTPAGFEILNGVLTPVDWWAIIFNPSLPLRYVHMLLAAYIATAFAVAGTAAWYLLRGRFVPLARPLLKIALVVIVPLVPLQILIGDQTGLLVGKHQPAKLAAIEGQWETGVMPLRLFALPDQAGERNRAEIGIPRLGSLIDEHSLNKPVTGLKAFPPEDRPRVSIVFWSFRVMVGLGLLMLGVAIAVPFLFRRRLVYHNKHFLRILIALSPSGFIAIIAGWYTAEIGRQPYVVYGLLRTAEVVSPVSAHEVSVSLALFVLVYAIVFGAGFWYLLKAIRVGPVEVELPPPLPTGRRPIAAFTEESATPQGAKHDRL